MHNYEGRPFLHGDTDCYGLIRDYYRQEHGLTLRNYARPTDWWAFKLDLYMQNFEEEGFEAIQIPLSKLRVSDLLLMAIRSEQANHAAVYIGEGKILHHLPNRLSKVDPLSGLFKSTVVAVLRHPAIPEPERGAPLNFMELLPAHVRRRLETP